MRALPQPDLRGVPAPAGLSTSVRKDGIVLIDQEKCRGWRMCISVAPHKDLFQLEERASPRSAFLLSAHRGRYAHGVFGTCVGRIRYLGVLLYDADKILGWPPPSEQDLYEKQLSVPRPTRPRGDCPGAQRMACRIP